MSEQSEARWHLDKRLNVGHILTTFTVAAGLFIWGGKVETRLSLLEQQYNQTKEIQQEIKQQLISMNDKLDRLIENLHRNGR